MTLDPRDCADGELAALGLAGNQAAFVEMMRRHRAPIFRLIRSYVGDADEALDLVQETFVAGFRALDRYDRERPLRAWLTTIALNKCRDWGRKRTVRRLFQFAAPIGEAAEQVADDRAGADVVTADRQALERVGRAIRALPRALKEPLILCAVDGLSQAEAADILAISEKAVETRLYRARTRLRETIGRLEG